MYGTKMESSPSRSHQEQEQQQQQQQQAPSLRQQKRQHYSTKTMDSIYSSILIDDDDDEHEHKEAHENSLKQPLLTSSHDNHHQFHDDEVVNDTVSFMPEEHNAMIDNTSLVYNKIILPCGVTIQCTNDVLIGCPLILRVLQIDISGCLNVLPYSVHSLITKQITIYINATYKYGTIHNPHVMNHSTTHHDSGWLIHVANDIPDKTKCVEIYNCFSYLQQRLHWNGHGLLLHEYCHLIHQICLTGEGSGSGDDAGSTNNDNVGISNNTNNGLFNPTIIKAYEKAQQSGLYDNVLRRDWAGKYEDYDMGKYSSILVLDSVVLASSFILSFFNLSW